MRSYRLQIAMIMIIAFSHVAVADNSGCWGDEDDKTRPEISCVKLTEGFLMGLRLATAEEVTKAFNAQGKQTGQHQLHFISAYQGDEGGSGFANVTFDDGVATVVDGLVETAGGSKEFIWNRKLGTCSDFVGSAFPNC